ncbi:MAG TPA: hypothetical protein VGZ51_01535, partial [Actinomycetota bacterium]|nr:hypothetical protein [Actinomycetota bacterium]
MRSLLRVALLLALAAMLALPAAASAQTTMSTGLTRVAGFPGTTGVTNSDLAFWGNYMYWGTYSGFRVFDISNPAAPVQLSNVICTTLPGSAGQGDISVWGNLVFRSVDTPQTTPDCATRRSTVGSVPGWEGVEIFDATNKAAPVQIKTVATDCGSHTHTLVPDLANNRVLLYVSSYPASGFGASTFGNQCSRPHNKISIIEVPLNAPGNASVINTAPLNTAPSSIFGAASPGTPFQACHDITVFMQLRLAAGACVSEGVIFDISDPANPTVRNRLVNPDIDVCGRALP